MKTNQICRLAAPLLVLLAANAQAITNGAVDGNKHPSTGALVDYDSRGTSYAFCTGTLISPTVMLTAAHCNPGVERVKVTFEATVQNAAVMYTGRYIAHPGYRPAQSDPHDIAVIVFDAPIAGITPARLPTAGLFDTLKIMVCSTPRTTPPQAMAARNALSMTRANRTSPTKTGASSQCPSSGRSTRHGCVCRKTPRAAMAVPALAIRAGRILSAAEAAKRQSWQAPPSRAIPSACRAMWCIGSTRRQRAAF